MEIEGLQTIQELNKDYLNTCRGSEQVQNFLEDAHQNEKLLLRFLIGRKYKAKYAWETLKRYAEVKFDLYPELFPNEYSENIRNFASQSEIAGQLKNRDKYGRRVDLFDCGAWDPDKYSTDEVISAVARLSHATYLESEWKNEGTIIIVQCSGIRARHFKECTVHNFRRVIDIFLHAYPVRMKGVFALNAPYLLSGAVKLFKCMLPAKLRKRIFVTSGDCLSCKELMELVSINELPKRFGGQVDFYEAVQNLKPLFE